MLSLGAQRQFLTHSEDMEEFQKTGTTFDKKSIKTV